MVTLPNSPRKSAAGNSVIDIETDTDYLKIAKKGGGHKGKWCSNQGLWQIIKYWAFAFTLQKLAINRTPTYSAG